MLSCASLCRIRTSALRCLRYWGIVTAFLVLGISQHAYLKMLIPAPSSHCRHWTLILCAGTLDPRMYRSVARTKLMTILLLTFPHVLEEGCLHFVARRLDILFGVDFASTPIIPSTEATKIKKCQRCWRHDSKYIFFFACSASGRHFYSVFAEWELTSAFMTLKS